MIALLIKPLGFKNNCYGLDSFVRIDCKLMNRPEAVTLAGIS